MRTQPPTRPSLPSLQDQHTSRVNPGPPDAFVPTIVSPPVTLSVKDQSPGSAAKQSFPYTVFVRTTFVAFWAPMESSTTGSLLLDAGGENAIEFSTGWTDVAAHNGNKSLALQRKVGDTVTFTGAIPGTYRVAGTIEATGTRSSCESSDSTRRKGRSARDGPSRIVLALQS